MNILRGGKIDRLAQKDAKTVCFAPSGLNSKRRYLFGANTFHDVIGYLCTHRQLPVKLAYSRFRDESKPATITYQYVKIYVDNPNNILFLTK